MDNAIDEALAGFCDHIEVTIKKGDVIEVTDNGRGIPVDIQPKLGIPAVTVVLTGCTPAASSAAKFRLQGGRRPARRGLSVVNARVSGWRSSSQGMAMNTTSGSSGACRMHPAKKLGPAASTGTTVRFKADPVMFTENHRL